MNYISNWFHFYETTESFEVHKKQGLINPDSICFLKQTGQIYTQNSFFGVCKERFEELERMILSHESAMRNILGIEGPSVDDGIVNNLADLVNFLDGFTDKDNLKEVIEAVQSALSSDIESVNRELSNRMTLLEQDNTNFTEQINSTVEALNSRVSSLSTTVGSHTESISELNTALQLHVKQYEAFKSSYNAYKEYVESKFESVKADINSTNSSLALLRSNVEELEERVGNLESSIGQTEEVLEEAKILVARLEDRFDEEVANNAQFKREVTEALNAFRNDIGEPNGIAGLDSMGKVPSSQLPSYVDDVIEKPALEAFPTTGEAGKIYVALDTNLTYRWSGSTYTEISASLALGETSSTAYAGNKGKKNAEDIASHMADRDNPHNVTKAQIGLGNVDNVSDMDKPISTAVQEALNNKVNIVPGKGLVSLEDANKIHETNEKVDTFEESLQYEVTRATTAENTINSSLTDHKADNTNPHGVTKSQVGLGNVDNTSDLDKPISTATQAVLGQLETDIDGLDALIDTKVDKVEGKGLSSNDFTDEYKSKVDTSVSSNKLTQDEIDLITDPDIGELVYNTTTNKYLYWDGSSWCNFAPDIDTSNLATKDDLNTVNSWRTIN